MSLGRLTTAVLLGLLFSSAHADNLQSGQRVTLAAGNNSAHGLFRTRVYYGDKASLGDGTVQTYVTMRRGRPRSVGVVFSKSMLDNLPDVPFDGNNCFDVNGDGELDVSAHRSSAWAAINESCSCRRRHQIHLSAGSC